MKTCSRCTVEKELAEFCKRKSSSDGLNYHCKSCAELENKAYREANPEKVLQNWNRYYAVHSERLKENAKRYYYDHIDDIRQYYVDNKETMVARSAARSKERKKTDVGFKLAGDLRRRINHAIGSVKAGSAFRDLGCSKEQLVAHLESLFTEGMTWDNHGNGDGKWHMDHIMPLSAFDLTNRQHFILAAHHLNLQPLWSVKNRSKGKKITYLTFELAA